MGTSETASSAARERSRASAKTQGKRSSAGRRQVLSESVSEEAIPFLLRQVAERLSRSLTEALKAFDQPPAVYRVLIALERSSPSGIGELAEATLIDPSTLSRTIDRMEEQGLVKRGPGSGDGRTVMVAVTAAGRDFFDRILPVASAQYEWSIRGVSPKNLGVLQITLKQMLHNLEVSPIK